MPLKVLIVVISAVVSATLGLWMTGLMGLVIGALVGAGSALLLFI